MCDMPEYDEHMWETQRLPIQIVYHDPDLPKLEFIEGKSDWIDLRASKDYVLHKGEFALIDLGVSMKLPEGYEAHIAPRSSTFKNFRIIQTNSVGVVDNSYSGTNDVWKMPVLAMENTCISKGDRVCQFRIMKKMEPVAFFETTCLDSEDRGGIGSTGIK